MYLNVNCGNACWNWGPIRFGIRPESETSLVPMTVSVDAVSALARVGTSMNITAAATPVSASASR